MEQNEKPKAFLIGYVVGCYYYNESEWLTNGNGFASNNPFANNHHPTIYVSLDRAVEIADSFVRNQYIKGGDTYVYFVREFLNETNQAGGMAVDYGIARTVYKVEIDKKKLKKLKKQKRKELNNKSEKKENEFIGKTGDEKEIESEMERAMREDLEEEQDEESKAYLLGMGCSDYSG